MRLLLLLPLAFLLLFHGTQSVCVPRDSKIKLRHSRSRTQSVPPPPKSETPSPPPPTPPSKSATPPPPQPTPPPKSATTPPQQSTPPPKSATPPPKSATPTPPQSASPPKSQTPSPPQATPPAKRQTPPTPPSALAKSDSKNASTPPTKPSSTPPPSTPPQEPKTPPAMNQIEFDTLAVKPEGSASTLCDKTDNPIICMAAVQPHLPSHGQVTPKDMLVMHVTASINKLDDAKAKATQMLSQTTLTPEQKSGLKTCKDNYDDAKSNFDEASQALATSDIDTVKVMLSAAISDVGSCDDGFAEIPGLGTPMDQTDGELGKFIDNCLALADLLH